MPATTVPVTIKLADFGGPDVAGVTVTARLSDVEFAADGTFVSTEPVIGVTDATGTVVLNVFPNAPTPTGLGTRGTSVQFTAMMPNSRPLQVDARIPNSPCSLVNTVVEDDGVALSASQMAALGAQESAAVATTQAGIATAGGNTATAQANIATTKAQTATDEATIATQAAADAAASYDSFDDRYLGAKAVEPLVDNDGNALLVGALYFNTAAGNMRVWTAALAWSVVSIATSAYMTGLLASATAAAARTSLGSGAAGDAIFIAGTTAAARTAMGATATGSALFIAATAAAARTALGSSVIGDAIFIAATAAAARGTLGSTATGDALFTAVTPAAARGTLGSGATGDALFLTATAAAARATLAAPSTSEIQAQTYTALLTTGTATAYVLTPTPALAAYGAASFFVSFHVVCGATPTINISGLGALNLVKQGQDGSFINLGAGDIPLGHRSRVTVVSPTQALLETFSGAGRWIGTQVISATSVYTPTPGTASIRVKVVGAGAAGGGCAATGSTQIAAAGGGGAGGCAESRLTSGFAGQTVTVGVGGAPAAGLGGGNGGTTSFGALLQATGGTGGQAGSVVAGGIITFVGGGIGGIGTGGNISNNKGQFGFNSLYGSNVPMSGPGGSSVMGGGGVNVSGTSPGVASNSFGAGGSGSSNGVSAAANAGGSGGNGVAYIDEYA